MKVKNKIILLALLVIATCVSSCTGEPLPEDLKQSFSLNKTGLYKIEWQSTEIQPFMKLTVVRQGIEIIKDRIIKEHSYDVELNRGDLIMIGINYEATTSRPTCYLAISRYNKLDWYNGSMNPDSLELLYEKESATNGVGFSAFINPEGKIDE